MHQRMVVGVDGSPQCDLAPGHAAGFANAVGAGPCLAHRVEAWLPPTPEMGLELARIAATRRAKGKAWLAEAARAYGAAAERQLVEAGTPAQPPAAARVQAAQSFAADPIVLGARGRSAVQRLLLGSMADGVARRAHVPVPRVH